jgi:single stranded DNA-binding protein
MPARNHVSLVGNLGKDPTAKQAGKTRVVELFLLVNERYQDSDGEWQRRTEPITVVLWDKVMQGQAVKWLQKGSSVVVSGRLHIHQYTHPKYPEVHMQRPEVHVEDIGFLGGLRLPPEPPQQNQPATPAEETTNG